MLTKLVAFSARRILTFQLCEFPHCKSMLRVRSSKQELHCWKCKVFTSDDCGEPVPPAGFATAKTASVIVDLSKNLHRVDAKICWCLCMVNCCSSYKSCANLGAQHHTCFYFILLTWTSFSVAGELWHQSK